MQLKDIIAAPSDNCTNAKVHFVKKKRDFSIPEVCTSVTTGLYYVVVFTAVAACQY